LAAEVERREQLPDPPAPLPGAATRADRELSRAEPNTLVFLGGNYQRCIDRIYCAREVIVEAGNVPVIVREFKDLPGENERDKSFRLLDLCPRAAFDGSMPGGWNAELEHLARESPVRPALIVFVNESLDASFPSRMVPTPASFTYQAYATTGDLRYRVLSWLNKTATSS
jgi:hypothetical protein